MVLEFSSESVHVDSVLLNLFDLSHVRVTVDVARVPEVLWNDCAVFLSLCDSFLVEVGILLFAQLWPMRTRTTTAEAAASDDKHDRKMTCTNQITL